MRKKTETVRLWSIKGLNIDDIMNRHIELVNTPIVEVVNWEEVLTCDTENIAKPKYKVIKKTKKMPRKSILFPKYLFLLHLIIVRCQNGEEGTTRLNYNLLKEVLGANIGDMLCTLKDMGIIGISPYYEIGKHARLIWLNNWEVTHEDITNQKVIKYAKKIKVLLDGSDSLKGVYTDDFINKYNESLSCLSMTHKDEALLYLSQKVYKSKHSEQFHYSKINNFDKVNNVITTIDRNNRIYHYLTNIPRELKNFFNIKYQVDISNSHPLLFSYFLLSKYKLQLDLIVELCKIKLDYKPVKINNNINYKSNIRYEGKKLRKTLKERGICVPKVTEVPNDVLVYIYRTSLGQFWNDFEELFEGMKREEIKVTLFREIFYSHATTVRGKMFGKKFVECYPNVWSVIRMYKKKQEFQLPNMMMAFESKLFGEILESCYNQNLKVVNIHDAIVVLDVEANIKCTSSMIKDIIKNVYSRYNLCPSVKVDTFVPANVLMAV